MDSENLPPGIPYLVRLFAITQLTLGAEGLRLALDDESIEIWAEDVATLTGTHPAHLGMALRVWVEAPDHDTATARAIGAAETCCNLLAISHGTGIRLSQATWTMDLSPASHDRVLVQHIIDFPTATRPVRQIDTTRLTSLVAGWNRSSGDRRLHTQLGRAMWHLRKAASTDDLAEQFGEIWLGLESINGELVAKHALPTRFVARHCERCGHPLEVVGSSAGIKFAIVTLAGATRDVARQAIQLRQALHHGRGSIYGELMHLPTLLPVLVDALALALADILEVPVGERDGLRRLLYPLPRSRGEVRVTVTLFNLSVDALLALEIPPTVALDRSAGEARRSDGVPQSSPIGRFRVGVRDYSGQWGNVTVTTTSRGDPEDSTPPRDAGTMTP